MTVFARNVSCKMAYQSGDTIANDYLRLQGRKGPWQSRNLLTGHRVGYRQLPVIPQLYPNVTSSSVTGVVLTDRSRSLLNTSPRLLEVRLLNLKVNSSRYDWRCSGTTHPWCVPSIHRLRRLATLWTPGIETCAGSPEDACTVIALVKPADSNPLYPLQPSVWTAAPGATTSETKDNKLCPEASRIFLILTRPNPLGSFTSTAMATMLFTAPRPRLPPFLTPPTMVSSTSTFPDSILRFESTMATRRRCNIVQATRYLTPSLRSSDLAENPVLAVVMCHAASNHVVKGVRVLSKMVPVVTDVWCRQKGQTSRPRLACHG